MKMFRFTSGAADQIGEAGIPQVEISRRGGPDRHELSRKLRHRTPMRHATATRIARAFAEATNTTTADAFARLFEEITE